MIKYIRTGLAGILLLVLATASGLALAGPAIQHPLNIATATARVVAPAAAGDQPHAAVSAGTQVTDTQVVDTSAVQQPVAVLDARTAVTEVGPAVVTIVNTQSVTSRRGRYMGTATAIGSGVIIDSRGYIVTNNHVIEGQQGLEVIFSDGSRAAATLVGADPSTDLAVVKVDVAVPAVAELGDSNALEPGQPVVAIGSALGDFRNTVTAGVVSGLHRDLDDSYSTSLRDLVQTDAAINHGNSGGPLISLDGQVIAINVAVVRNSGMGGEVAEGLGFAIPSSTVREVTGHLIGK